MAPLVGGYWRTIGAEKMAADILRSRVRLYDWQDELESPIGWHPVEDGINYVGLPMNTTRPFDTSSCPTYDTYREGYFNFTQYPMTYATSLVAQGRTAILSNFNSKGVAFARGLQDLGDDSSSCAPFTTGGNRNERFFNFIKAFPPSCPDPTSSSCDTIDFVNVGHDSGQMMASPAGQARLFIDNFYGDKKRAFDFGYPRIQAGDDRFGMSSSGATKSVLSFVVADGV